jgi:hypothetical protein
MIRRILFLVLLFRVAAFAQFTTVTGTVTDPNGLAYTFGTISPTLVSSGSPTLSGLAYTPPTQPTGLNLQGSFTMRLADVSVLSPGSSTWSFHVCSAVGTVSPAFGKGPVCFDVTGISISGASQDIGATLSASALALTSPFGAGTGCGSGTTNTIMMFTASTTCGNSPIVFNGSTLITISKQVTISAFGAAFNINGVLASYNGLTSLGNSVAQVVGLAQGSAFTANMGSVQLGVAVPASGHQFYRVNCYLVVTTAAGTSSTLPQCQVSWTDANTSVVETTTFSPTSSANTVGTFVQGTFFFNPKPGTTISVSTTGYASNPGAAMIYVNGFDMEAL